MTHPHPAAVRLGECVRWRGVTVSAAGDAASLSFTRPDGAVLRLRLDGACAAALAVALGRYAGRLSGSQSDRSSGSPSLSVSMPSGGENV